MREENLLQNSSSDLCDLCPDDFTSIGHIFAPLPEGSIFWKSSS